MRAGSLCGRQLRRFGLTQTRDLTNKSVFFSLFCYFFVDLCAGNPYKSAPSQAYPAFFEDNEKPNQSIQSIMKKKKLPQNGFTPMSAVVAGCALAAAGVQAQPVFDATFPASW